VVVIRDAALENHYNSCSRRIFFNRLQRHWQQRPKRLDFLYTSTLPTALILYRTAMANAASNPSGRLQLSGAGTALITPFTSDGEEVDYEAFGKLIDGQIAGGIDFLVPLGTTGECPTVTSEEFAKILEFTVRRVNGRVPVVAGTGSNCTKKAIAATKLAKKIGCDACLQVNPYYNKPSQEGMFLHFQKICSEAGLPVVLYNIPGRTGITMQPETVARLYAECPEIIAIKEATGSLDIATKIAELCDIPILSGDDSLTIPLMSIGGKGVVSVLSNVFPEIVVGNVRAAQKGDFATASKRHVKYHKLMRTMFCETNPVPVKKTASLLGMCTDVARLPISPMLAKNEAILTACLKEYGLIE
jgi:4-hydroxy-tetrahydrodipicolinate synthase